jgi:hypothetical protein
MTEKTKQGSFHTIWFWPYGKNPDGDNILVAQRIAYTLSYYTVTAKCRLNGKLRLQYTAAGRRDKLSDQMHVFTLYDFICTAEFDQTQSLKFMINIYNDL